jgi:DNA-binding response OmpR family regulator
MPSSYIETARFIIVGPDKGFKAKVERYLLLSNAVNVKSAEDPLTALRIAQSGSFQPDCIIASYDTLPLNGLQFLGNLRAKRYGGKPLSEVRFILALKEPADDLVVMAYRYLANSVIVGAFERDEFIGRVQRVLKQPWTTTDQLTEPWSAGPGNGSGPNDPDRTSSDAATSKNSRTVRVAHIRKNSRDLILVPLESAFGACPDEKKRIIIEALENGAAKAGLRGDVVAVWPGKEGGMEFLAPVSLHRTLRGITLSDVRSTINALVEVS